ncbi:MAG TPA: nuclear transport factor 2 family protein [Gaiellaceae bacterium]|nr:nuclear transport factor 2 family protein [Gaiellaceae bacterium]
MEAVAAARAVIDAWQARDWDQLRALFHPDARLETQAGGAAMLSGEETLRTLQQALRDGLYEPRVHEFTALDDRAVLLRGSARYRRPEGGFADTTRCWLYVFDGGLLHRSRLFGDASQAREAYAELGPSLGVGRCG